MPRLTLLVSFLICATIAIALEIAVTPLPKATDNNTSETNSISAGADKNPAEETLCKEKDNKTPSLDDILKGNPSAPRSASSNAALAKSAKPVLSSYTYDNQRDLLNQAAANKKESRLEAERLARKLERLNRKARAKAEAARMDSLNTSLGQKQDTDKKTSHHKHI